MIVLHNSYHPDREILVNPAHITRVYDIPAEEPFPNSPAETRVHFHCGQEIVVAETLEEVKNLLKTPRTIPLSDILRQ